MKKKITSIVAALLIVTSVNVYATDTSKYKNKINQNNSKINELSSEKKEVQEKKNAVSSEVSKIVSNINQLSGEIEKLSGNIAVKEAGITQKAKDIEAMVLKIGELEASIVTQINEIRGQEEELTKQEDILSERVRSAYKFNSFGSMIFTLMQSTSIVDFTERLMFIEKMAEKDREVMAIIDGIIVDLETKRAELEANKAESESIKAKLDTEKVSLENEKASLLSEKSSVESKLAEQRNLEESKKTLLANMTQEEREIADAIGDIMEENEKLEEEVQRVIRAAQEKARREAEARAKANAGKNQKPAASASVSSGGFVRPVGGRISSPYGYRIHPISGRRQMHRGVDYAAPMGAAVGSTKAGTVIVRTYNSSYGNYIIVDHGNGIASLYAHLSGFAVKNGQTVGRGQTIGYIGSTGSSTGPHLHFEIRVNGVHKNPVNYVK
jgi:murein DD-endopeptidase MepM/ murein hydrolase activator NlpD